MMVPAKKIDPLVSLIVGVNEEERAQILYQFLESVRALEENIPYEVIVVAKRNKERERVFREKYPWARLILSDRSSSGGYFRNTAVKHAKGQYLAFFEDHVIVHKHYLRNLVRSFEKGYDFVGGSVTNGNPETIASWIQYLCEYHKWLPCLKGGPKEDLPGSNFACKRHVFSRLGEFSQEKFKLESHFFHDARKSGYTLYFAPEVRTSHFNEKRTMYFSKKRFQYGRLYAALRGFSLPKRLFYTFFSPLIAILEYGRIFNHARCSKTYLKKFILCGPQLLITLFIWMGGECMGYIFGADAK